MRSTARYRVGAHVAVRQDGPVLNRPGRHSRPWRFIVSRRQCAAPLRLIFPQPRVVASAGAQEVGVRLHPRLRGLSVNSRLRLRTPSYVGSPEHKQRLAISCLARTGLMLDRGRRTNETPDSLRAC